MSETRSPDPLRRQPPVIDVDAKEVRPADPKGKADGGAPDQARTAIEPVATTGLGSEPFPKVSAPSVTTGKGATTSGPAAGSATGPKPAAPDPKPASPPTKPAAAVSVPASPTPKPAATDTKPSPDPAKASPSGPPGTTPSPSVAAPARSVLPAALAAGIVGAILSAAAVWFLLRSGDADVDDRVSALERRIASLPSGNPAAALEPRLATLEAAVRQAADDARATRAAADAATRQAAERPAVPAGDTASKGALDALTARVEDVGRQAGTAATGLGDLGQRLDALATRTQEGLAAAGTANAAVGASVTGLRTDATTVRTGLAAAETRLGEGEKKLAAISTTLEGVTGDLARLQPAASQAGLRIAVSGRLDDALRTGAPLAPPIGALERLGLEAGLLAPLRPYATAAAPSAGALLAEFRPMADTLTAEPRPAEESLLDKARRLLFKVVTVRAVGDGSGADLPGLVARIEASLGRGAVGEAAAAWDRLPEAARRSTAAWGERLKGRAAADDAARRIGAQALAGLETVTR